MTAVLGLDLSIAATGICYPDGTTATIKGDVKIGDRRLVRVAGTVHKALIDGVDLAVIEDLPTHAHGAGVTGMVHGAVRALLLDVGVPYALITPATLKAFATGKGTAGKPAMAVAAFERSERKFADDNQCDAWWCWMAGMTRLGTAPFSVPKAQRARLDAVAWPDNLPEVTRNG